MVGTARGRWWAVIGVVLGMLVSGAPGASADATGAARHGAHAGGVDLARLDRFVQDQRAKHRIPGLTLALVENGRVTTVRGYGEAEPGRAMTADVPMPIGSMAKTVTAVAVLRLAERGLLALDAPVRNHLPWFRVADEAASRAITVRHLLTHTSGLSERGYNRVLDPATTLEEGVRDLARARPTAPVGTRHQYFNPNYSTLALIVEAVSGQSYGEFVRGSIFEPLGMRDSLVGYPDPAVARMAQGHSKVFGFPVPVDDPFRAHLVGAGSVVSTAPDLARLAAAVGGDGSYDGVRILSPRSVDLMRTPADAGGPHYGMGWETGRRHGEPVGGHSGADPAFLGRMAMMPQLGNGYVVLLNEEHLLDAMVVLPQLGDGLIDLLLDVPAEERGLSAVVVGWIALAVFVGSLAASGIALWRLRGWRERANTLSRAGLVRTVLPHFLVPGVLLAAIYLLAPVLLGDRAFNLGYIGRYYLPDVVLLLAAATIPDLVQGAYKLGVVVADRRRARVPA